MPGTPPSFVPSKGGFEIPVSIEDDNEDEDGEKHIVNDHEDLDEDVEVAEFFGAKSRAFSVFREDVGKYGRSDACRGCKAIGRGWKRPVAHSDSCRQRVMGKTFEEGGVEGRTANATRRALEHQYSMESELGPLLVDETKATRRGRGNIKSRE